MTYEPERDPQNPLDVNPQPRNDRDERRAMSAGLWVGIVAALAIATFLMFNMGRDNNVVTRTDEPAATTGAGSTTPAPATRDMGTQTNAPAPNTPRPAPAPANQ